VSPAGTAGRTGRTGPRPVPPGGPARPSRPRRTGRAAVLAIVLCAIALTLAYPVREYIADRRQIDQLAASNARLAQEVRHLKSEARSLATPTVIEQEARDDLHMCFPSQTCYDVIPLPSPRDKTTAKPAGSPWYGRLWQSVQKADGTAAR
jgi:cell division protein FtsB